MVKADRVVPRSSIGLMTEQERFIKSSKPIVAYIGGIGSGKTFVSCIKAVLNAIDGRNQLMVGLTFPHARDVLAKTLSKVLDMMGFIEGYHWSMNKTSLEFSILGRATIYIKSAELGDKLRGYNVADIFIDEASYHKDDSVFNILIGRMREVEDAQIHLTTSPNGFNWVYDLTKSSDCDFITVSTFENPFLPDQYIRNMINRYSSTFIRQELYAEFVNISTGIFDSNFIKTVRTIPNGQSVRFWDFAFGSGDKADYSAGVLLTKVGQEYYIEDIVRVKQEYNDLKNTIIKTAQRDGRDVVIGFESAGQQKAVVNDLVRLPQLAGYIKKSLQVAKYGHKMKRVLPVASLAENGQLHILSTCSNKREFFDECDALTMDDTHAHDDMVDALASAYISLNDLPVARGYRSNIY